MTDRRRGLGVSRFAQRLAALLAFAAASVGAARALGQEPVAFPGAALVRDVVLRADVQPPADRGVARVNASVSLPVATLTTAVAAGGLTIELRAAPTVAFALHWGADQCRLRSSAAGAIVDCLSTGAAAAARVRLRPRAASDLYDLTVTARGLAIAAPLSNDAVRLALSTAGLTRVDDISACRVSGRDRRVKACRQRVADPPPSPSPSATASASSTATPTGTRTRTATATGTITETFTPSRTRTVTRTPTESRTPTQTRTPTITRTPTVTETPTPWVAGGPLGVRVYVVDTVGEPSGIDSMSGTGGTLGPLTLEIAAGQPDGNGLAPLSLVQDATLAASVWRSDAGASPHKFLCFRLLAAGSSGSVDCNGGTAFDVVGSQPTGPGTALTLQTGLGGPAGPGDAALLVQMQRSAPIDAAQFHPNGCAAAVYEAPQLVALTTTTATAVKRTLSFTRTGEPFDCAVWSVRDTGGQFVMPAPTYFQPPPLPAHRGDEALVVTLAEDGDHQRSAVCAFDAPGPSRVEIRTAGGDAPLVVPLAGAIEMRGSRVFGRGMVGGSSLLSLAPAEIPGIGFLCGEPTTGCDGLSIDCAGTGRTDRDVVTTTNAAPCDGPRSCNWACEDYCRTLDMRPSKSVCTGWCAVPSCTCLPSAPCSCSEFTCTSDAECQRPVSDSSRGLLLPVMADHCGGPEPVDAPGQCQCTCGVSASPTSRPGQTGLGVAVSLWIDASSQCDRSDTVTELGSSCLQLSSARVHSALLGADGGAPTLLSELDGAPLSCNRFTAGDTSGLEMRDTLHVLDSDLGAAALDVFVDCQ